MMNSKGFSLIELIISIAIIGILSSIFLPNLSLIQNKAKETNLKSVLNSLQVGVESYNFSKGGYPSGSLDLFQLTTKLQETGDLTKLPNNPFTGKQYASDDSSGKILYGYDSSTNHYQLSAYGVNNQSVVATAENN